MKNKTKPMMNNLSLANVLVCLVILASCAGTNARLSVKNTHHDIHHNHISIDTHLISKPKPKPNPNHNKQTMITYHGGPLLTNSGTLNVYLIWYGYFSLKEKSVIRDFFASFNPSTTLLQKGQPTVAKWWQTIKSYKDKRGDSVPGTIRLAKQLGDKYSLGKKMINRAQIADLVQTKLDNKSFPRDPNGIYLVLTSKDVTVERFCMSTCGFHGSTYKPLNKVVIAHVGDASLQCPGFCAWPYAKPTYAPHFKPFVAPNGVGTDSIAMNIATVIAGAATSPFGDGYYQGDAHAPLEAVSACSGKFGVGAFPGFPGKLLMDPPSNASFNAYGANGRKFLLPAMWDLPGSTCKVA